MGRTEEFAKRKQAKTNRKRARADVGAQINAEESQAAKRRRRKGSRRGCEGMCYTLPTADNPFNEAELKSKKKKWPKQEVDGDGEAEDDKPRRRRRKKNKGPENDEDEGEDLELNGTGLGQPEEGKARREKANGRESPSASKDGVSAELNGHDMVETRVESQRRRLKKFQKVFWPGQEEGRAAIAGWKDERLRNVKGLRKAAKAVLAEVGLEGDEIPVHRRTDVMGLVYQFWHGLLRGRDILSLIPQRLIGAATAGYVAGSLPHLRAQLPIEVRKGPSMLVLVPTRERAALVLKACKPLRERAGLWAVSVHSDAAIEHQMLGLKSMAVAIVVGTPQRILELSAKRALSLAQITFLVLDSADEIMRLGFEVQARKISSKVREDRQAVVVTSTLGETVTDVARAWLHDPVERAVAKIQ